MTKTLTTTAVIKADIAHEVKLWKAAELPVKLTKADRKMTFLYAKELKYMYSM